MSRLDKLIESKPMQALQKAGAAMQGNAVVGAISDGMGSAMSLLLAGAIFTIISTVLRLAGVLDTTDQVYQWLQLPYNMTMGIMSVAVAFSIAYSYSGSLNMTSKVANGIVSLFMFLMVSAPMTSVELADGSRMSVMDTTNLGATGLFTAMLIGIVSVRIIKFCKDKHIVITMPDSIPQFLADSFTTLIPLVINIVVWQGLSIALQLTVGSTLPDAIITVLSGPLSVLTSVPGMFLLMFITNVMWIFGIHGGVITTIVISAPKMMAFQENAALVAAGMAPMFFPVFLTRYGGAAAAGGMGNALCISLHCMRARSQQLRAIGKAGFIPSLFNISEPIIFGLPVMYNPLIAIPFILNALIPPFIAWIGFEVGFFVPPYILLSGVYPLGVFEFLSSMAWQNLLIPVIGFVVGMIVYAPFIKMYDKECLEKEQAAEAEAAQAAQAA